MIRRGESGRAVEIDVATAGIRILRLNRPEQLNAMNEDLIEDLGHAIEHLAEDGACRVVILTGSGRAFCAGGDLATLEASRIHRDPIETTRSLLRRSAALVLALQRLPQPVIAAVNGPAAGGGLALALASDTRICSESAHFSTAFVKLGLSGFEMGMSALLPRIVGPTAAFEMAASGRRIDAASALRLGLVLEVVDGAILLERAIDIARTIVANSPIGVRTTKQLLWLHAGQGNLDEVVETEIAAQLRCTRTADHGEAIAAFTERRLPTFTGA